VVTALALAWLTSAASAVTITTFPIPTNFAAPRGIALGADGAIWFTEFQGSKTGRITTAGTITEFEAPIDSTGNIPTAFGNQIVAGPDGALWFTKMAGDYIGRIETSGMAKLMLLPTRSNQMSGITVGSDGALWFPLTDLNRIGRMTTGGAVTEFALPDGLFSATAITAGPDGALWFTYATSVGAGIGRMTTAGVLTNQFALSAGSTANGLTFGPDGNLWVTQNFANGFGRIGRMTTAGVVSDFTVPTQHAAPFGITVGPDGALWFTEFSRDNIGRITTAGAITEFPIGTLNGDSGVVGITAGPGGTLWFTASRSNAIGRVVVGEQVVAITAGPSGLVHETSATFEFSAGATAPAGGFECRIDGQAAFTTCTSPVVLSNLSDGEHTFRVRHKPDEGPAGTPVERTWTVDATVPTVTFDQAPAGDGNEPNVDIAWHASEDSASFVCSLDAGARFDCQSPQALFGLADGPHTFSVEPFDAAGNAGPVATIGWRVGTAPAEPGPTATPAPAPAPVCAAGSSAGFGVIRVVARAADACFVDETIAGVAAKVSRGVVTLNGIRLTPGPGTRIIVSERLGDGSVRADGPVTVGFGDTIPIPLPSLNLDGLLAGTTVVKQGLAIAEGALQVAGMKFAPGLALEFAAENGGQAKVTFRMTLPKAVFSATSVKGEGVTVEFSPTFSNDRGVTLGGRIKMPKVFFLGEEIKDLDLAYDHTTGVFDGSAGFVLGEAKKGLAESTLTVAIGLGITSSVCEVRKLSLVASNLNRHIGDGVFLQRLGGSLECSSTGTGPTLRRVVKITGGAGLSLGPRIAVGSFETEAVSVDGTATLTFPFDAPTVSGFSLEMKGTGKIVDVPVTEQSIKYTPPAQIEVGGSIDATVGGYGARLVQQNSWISERGFNIEGAGQVNMFGFRSAAEAVFSSTGYAVCMGPANAHLGFGRRWSGGFTSWVSGCDVGPFRSALPAARVATAGLKAGPQTLEVPAGRKLVVLGFAGQGAPPKVVLTGPGGQRIETPRDLRPLDTKSAVVVQDTDQNITIVALYSPASGNWTVGTALESSVLGAIRMAENLPPVALRASVRRTRGGKRILTYRVRGLAGQTVQFTERGNDAAHVIATTGRAAGTLRFTPDPVLGRNRTIQAIVANNGMPRLARTVARFTVEPPPRPRRVTKVRLRARTLTWRRQPGVTRFEIAITAPDRTTSIDTSQRPRLKLRATLPRSGTLRVTIVALDAVGRHSPIKTTRHRLRATP